MSLRTFARRCFRWPRNSHGLMHMCVCVVVLCVWALPRVPGEAEHEQRAARARAALTFAEASSGDETKEGGEVDMAAEAELDAALQRAAEGALGGREGTVLVLDAQTGRLRAVVNPRMAFTQALPPGSTIKPFTTLAALRSGLIDKGTRTLCREHYAHGDFEISCSHPRLKPPFNPSQALAYSCNYYYSKLGERLSVEQFDTVLGSFGFGTPTGAGVAGEARGRLPRGEWRVSNALGESRQLLVTPAQLLVAYAALFNGGHLFVPGQSVAQDFRAQPRAQLDIAPEHRALLVEGMRGAVAYGTAARAGLSALSPYIFGKTGTSTPLDGFRTQGWFVGFAAERNDAETAPPEKVRLAVLVFVRHAHGAECAELARPIFEEYARSVERREEERRDARQRDEARATSAERETVQQQLAGRENAEKNASQASAAGAEGVGVAGSPEDGEGVAGTVGGVSGDAGASSGSSVSAESSARAGRVRVRVAGERAARELSLEDYVFGVLAAEGSVESELEALKAQAVVSRTYALKNLRRHARDGYDFCTSTHCQRYLGVADEGVRADFYELLHRAVGETTGEILRDALGRTADAYFSAACGGETANVRTLWGVDEAPSYLRGVHDDYCAGTSYSSWTDTIASSQLLKALRADRRTDVGARLDDVRILRRDRTGRAEQLLLEGERRRLVRGWDFKIIVGRTLGWSLLKSTRFEVARSGDRFVFRGSGFGHGLGLCQTGAHVMARRGAGYRQILNQYLPGTSVGHGNAAQTASATRVETSLTTPPQVIYKLPPATGARPAATSRQPSAQPVLFRPARFTSSDTRASWTTQDDDVAWQALRAVAPADFVAAGAFVASSQRRGLASKRLVLASEHFRSSYPARFDEREVEPVLRTLEAARNDLERRLDAASLRAAGLSTVELFVHETTADFVAATGQPPWVAAATRARRIDTQPLDVLRRRGVLDTSLRHEYAHAVIQALGRGRTPRWLAEGLACYVAGEGSMLTRLEPPRAVPVEELERRLAAASSARELRSLYAAAYREVAALIRREGEPDVWRRVARS